jgi:hypothetical protein
VNLDPAPTVPGTMYITVTAYNKVPYIDSVPIVTPTGPYLAAGSYVIEDGNNNQVNPGDTVQFGLWAKNIGVEPALAVYGLLSEDDAYVTMLGDSSWYGNIAPSDSVLSSPYYGFVVSDDCPDGHSINFTAEFTDDVDSTWMSNVAVTVYAPLLVHEYHVVSGGNGNGVLEPGETVDLMVALQNGGSAAAADVVATISTADAYLTVLTDTASYGDIAVDSTVLCQTPYVVQADSLAPTPHVVQVVMSITGTNYAAVDTFPLVIGNIGFYDTVEDTAVTNQYTVEGQWHRTQRRSYSPSYSWWNGNEATGVYSNNVDASIVTPLITLATNSEFECWNWYDLESGYDYGYIELSTDGGSSWEQLISFNGASGVWEQYSTTLDYPAGTQVRIRFRLDTDYSVVEEGWYVDDVRVFDPFGVTESESGVFGTSQRTAFIGVSPNPFMQSARMSYQLVRPARVSLIVYDVSGRLVKSLSDGQDLQEPGNYSVLWDGRDDVGRTVPAGVYFVRFHADDCQQVHKTVLLK